MGYITKSSEAPLEDSDDCCEGLSVVVQVITVFFASFIGGSFFSQFKQWIQNPTSAITIIGSAAPRTSQFFLSFVILQVSSSDLTLSCTLFATSGDTKSQEEPSTGCSVSLPIGCWARRHKGQTQRARPRLDSNVFLICVTEPERVGLVSQQYRIPSALL